MEHTTLITISVTDLLGDKPIRNATVRVFRVGSGSGAGAEEGTARAPDDKSSSVPASSHPVFTGSTDTSGRVHPHLEPATYRATANAFHMDARPVTFDVPEGCSDAIPLKIPIGFYIKTVMIREDCQEVDNCVNFTAGATAVVRAYYNDIGTHRFGVRWTPQPGPVVLTEVPVPEDTRWHEARFSTSGLHGAVRIRATLHDNPDVDAEAVINVAERPVQPISGTVGVNLRRSAVPPTSDQALWVAIRNRTRAISFSGTGAPGTGYRDFINRVLCNQEPLDPVNPRLTRELNELGTQVHGVAAYDLLKTATQAFLLLECGVAIDNKLYDPRSEEGRLGELVDFATIRQRLLNYLGGPALHRLPYIDRIIRAAFPGLEQGPVFCHGVLTSRVDGPCLLELIWSYWHEEGMLAQTINAVSRRFQNVRAPRDRDPLAHLEIDPLRPLNNLLWGHVQDEWNRLTVKRRAYEYDHHYGLTLYGKAISSFRPADSRSKFLEAFHNLLHLCSVFFKEDNDTTVIADGYPLLNALKEVHLLLAQGAHNQFGDLPWTARVEMLIQEWLLGRQEMRDFLQSRAMVPYKEEWMPQVDTMKTLQGWSDVTVTHFRDLGVYGEQILLSIRYGDWIDINDEDSAKNWARYWRPEIQAYLHAYRAVTGVDLGNPDTVDPTMPSVHLQRRLASQRSR